MLPLKSKRDKYNPRCLWRAWHAFYICLNSKLFYLYINNEITTFRIYENQFICLDEGPKTVSVVQASGIRSPQVPINNHSPTWDGLYGHIVSRLWIDLLRGNHHIILCVTLKCALVHVMVLGVGSVIKVHNRMAVMAIRLSRLIPWIIHQPAGPVSAHEEGCRWSGECRWLKRREQLRREGARYANILKCLILSIVLAPKFFICITNSAKHQTLKKKETHNCSFINYKSILGSESPGHNISMVTTSKD